MWSALGGTFTYAVGLALSPFAITTAIVLLLGTKGRLKTAMFGLGWFISIGIVTAIATTITDAADDDYPEQTADGVDILQLVFAALFFGLAYLTWRKRSTKVGGAEAEDGKVKKPGLLDRLDNLSVVACLALGVAQGVLVIKNIPLALTAGARIGEAGLTNADSIVAVVIFALLASLGVLIPLVAAILGGERLQPSFARTRLWIEEHLIAITLVILVVLGAHFLGQGLALTK